LGGGGQGDVYLAELAKCAEERDRIKGTLLSSIGTIALSVDESERHEGVNRLTAAIRDVARSEMPSDYGALKHLKISEDRDPAQALGGFQSEIKALEAARGDSALLNVIDSDGERGWMVTEYHDGGTLADHLSRFTGNIPAALAAFRPLVAAVAKLHESVPHVIHRDIKPHNIFVAADGRLVLGDFGIVLFTDAKGERVTKTYGERVGTRDWIAPWAYAERRLDSPAPSLDVFPLGKLLWTMLSGDGILPFWEFDRDEYDLTKRYPQQASEFGLVNEVLAKCVVREERACLENAGQLLLLVDELASVIQRKKQALSDRVVRFCTVCGIGEYSVQEASAEREKKGRDDSYHCPCGRNSAS
jgi:serine/threonine protein kinase